MYKLVYLLCKWVFPKIGVPQNGWFIIMENSIKMDDLGGPPLFLETPKYLMRPCLFFFVYSRLLRM